MSEDFAKLLLQVIGVIFGGGTLQLLIFIIKKRASLKALDRASDSTQLTSANEYIVIQGDDIKEMRKEIKRLKEEYVTMERRLKSCESEASENMRTSQESIARLTTMLGRARAQLSVIDVTDPELGLDPSSRPSRHRRQEGYDEPI